VSGNGVCTFCFAKPELAAAGIRDDVIHAYRYWWLIKQPEAKRAVTKQSAGMLALKRHATRVQDLTAEEAAELIKAAPDAALRLCAEKGITPSGEFTFGLNQGEHSGQSIPHLHGHVLPDSPEDPAELRGNGIGAAFKALHAEKLK
jgi:diadenosine tetraphosphate (Ap4A) HIT family hydrolase